MRLDSSSIGALGTATDDLMRRHVMMGYGFDGGGLWWIWMVGGMLVMIGLVVVIVWGIVAVSRGGAGREPERPTALDILRERYARGEITQQEFDNVYQDIRSTKGFSEAGTYTPTLTNVANLDASTAFLCRYTRTGDIVTVSGLVGVNPTLTATVTTLNLSLPISSGLTAVSQLSGVSFSPEVSGMGAAFFGDVTNDRAVMEFVSNDIGSRAMYFIFTYQVL